MISALVKVDSVSLFIYGANDANGVVEANDSFDKVVLVRHYVCVCLFGLLYTNSRRMELLLREHMINEII